MPEFQYLASNREGASVSGSLDAESLAAAEARLRAMGLVPIKVRTGGKARVPALSQGAAAGNSWFSRLGTRRDKGVGPEDVASLTSELAVMLKAGLPLDRAVRVMVQMGGRPAVVEVLEQMLASIKGGKSFSVALSAHHALFGDFYINMVRSGEVSGQLAEVLARLSEHLERVKELRQSVVSALIYPSILLTVAILSVFMMLGFVVPQFETLFSEMGDALPLPTRVIIDLGHFVADWGLAMAVGLSGVAFVLTRWLKTPDGRVHKDRLLLALPVLGPVLRKYELTQFARSMGTLIGNGVPIVTALQIALSTLGSPAIKGGLASLEPAVKRGERLADALASTGVFSPLALNMVRLGEETGRLDSMLLEVARVQDVEIQTGIKRGLTLLEPAMILVLGVVIASIIVSLLMGILSVNDLAV